MTIKKLIEELSKYNPETVIDFKLIPDTPEACEDDRHDQTIYFLGEIGTSLLDSNPPILEIGFANNPKCPYCEENRKSEHFICDMCGVGMCEKCYQSMVEHDGHYNEICENADEAEYEAIVKEIGYEPAYLCEDCLKEIIEKYKIK